MDFYAGVGERLRMARVRAGLSQAELGARLGRSASAINRYETGQRRLPLHDLVRLCGILHVPPEELLTPPRAAGRRSRRFQGGLRPLRLTADEARALRDLGRRLAYALPGPDLHQVGDARADYAPADSPRRIQEYVDGLTSQQLRALVRGAGWSGPVDLTALRRYTALVLRDFTRPPGREHP